MLRNEEDEREKNFSDIERLISLKVDGRVQRFALVLDDVTRNGLAEFFAENIILKMGHLRPLF